MCISLFPLFVSLVQIIKNYVTTVSNPRYYNIKQDVET
jgi:hypothetical protein